MKKLAPTIRSFFILSLVLAMLVPSFAGASNWVRAKIGVLILNDDQSRLAKTTDSLAPGTKMQIHVIPEKNCYLYLINSDGQKATWLNYGDDQKQVTQGEEKIYPSKFSLYEQKGGNDMESFTVICSPQKLTAMTQLFSTRSVSISQWRALENKWIKDSKIPLGETLSKPFGIAGSVRAATTEASQKFKVYSGNSMLVKKYEFHVKK